MKIYEIGTGYTPIPAQMGAATEIVVEELTRSFLKNGQEVEIIDIKAEKRAETELPITEVKVPRAFTKTDVSLGIMHKLKRVVYSVCLAKKLKKILKNTNEKIILHFHNQYNMFFFLKLVPKKLRKKAITAYTVHSYIWHGEWENIKDTINKRYFQELFCLEFSDIVFLLNEKTFHNVSEHTNINKEKIKLINNGVNTETYFPFCYSEKDKAKEKYNLCGKTVFIQVGSVCERKNQKYSLELLMPLMKDHKDIVFCYAGGIISQDYQDSIIDYARSNGVYDQVFYFGEISPGKVLNEIYNVADAMIFPSKAEGFSLVIVEAMSAGVPVVVNKDLDFKLSSDCLKYENQEDFADLIKHNILNKAIHDGLSDKSRCVIKENFSWNIIAKEYIDYIISED